ncbi:hypothetical protein C8Q74DRAFT_1372557 [Fomes fomentarius]|nr:hypothetical protein C8Q74DRAFT_1372557 [Fomes fomentarius]
MQLDEYMGESLVEPQKMEAAVKWLQESNLVEACKLGKAIIRKRVLQSAAAYGLPWANNLEHVNYSLGLGTSTRQCTVVFLDHKQQLHLQLRADALLRGRHRPLPPIRPRLPLLASVLDCSRSQPSLLVEPQAHKIVFLLGWYPLKTAVKMHGPGGIVTFAFHDKIKVKARMALYLAARDVLQVGAALRPLSIKPFQRM